MASRECPNCHSKKNWKRGIRETAFGLFSAISAGNVSSRFSEKSYKDCLLN